MRQVSHLSLPARPLAIMPGLRPGPAIAYTLVANAAGVPVHLTWEDGSRIVLCEAGLNLPGRTFSFSFLEGRP
jgi:hypothetical protein